LFLKILFLKYCCFSRFIIINWGAADIQQYLSLSLNI
jgi:hypothetical protein